MLLADDPHEHLVDIECVTVALVLSLESSGNPRAKLDAPEADGFITEVSASSG